VYYLVLNNYQIQVVLHPNLHFGYQYKILEILKVLYEEKEREKSYLAPIFLYDLNLVFFFGFLISRI
jgi:hypothetical protein